MGCMSKPDHLHSIYIPSSLSYNKYPAVFAIQPTKHICPTHIRQPAFIECAYSNKVKVYTHPILRF